MPREVYKLYRLIKYLYSILMTTNLKNYLDSPYNMHAKQFYTKQLCTLYFIGAHYTKMRREREHALLKYTRVK